MAYDCGQPVMGMKFWLNQTSGDSSRTHKFDSGPITIGSGASADIVLEHPSVRPLHARIEFDSSAPELPKLTTLDTAASTRVDGQLVTGTVDLRDRARLQLGDVTFVFGYEHPTLDSVLPEPPDGSAPRYQTPEMKWDELEDETVPTEDDTTLSQDGLAESARRAAAMTGENAGFDEATLEDEFTRPNPESFQPDARTVPRDVLQNADGSDEPTISSKYEGSTALPEFDVEPTELKPVEEIQISTEPTDETRSEPQPIEKAHGAQSTDLTDDGLKSWDEIAEKAPADDEPGPTPQTDFERIRAAQNKSEGGPNTALLILGVLAILGLLYFILTPEATKKARIAEAESETISEAIIFRSDETECFGEAECLDRARTNYEIGIELLEDQNVAVKNQFEGWVRLELAQKFLEKAGVQKIDGFENLDEKSDEARKSLDETFKAYEVEYLEFEKREMYPEMADVLHKVRARFPHPGSREYRWAMARELEMKEDGTYPSAYP